MEYWDIPQTITHWSLKNKMAKLLKITLSMIVKNEEKYLRECLESVRGVVNEIILIDTGSSDNTINIASEYGAKIYNYVWINDFSAARNYALSKSSGDWILYLDADERLAGSSVNELRSVTANDKMIGCRCIVNNLDEINGKPKYNRYTRLFRNNGSIRFSGAVHEQIDESLTKNGFEIINTNIQIIHTGYNVTDDELKKKARRNLSILENVYMENNSAYNAYQLANTYSILEENEIAYKYYLESVGSSDLIGDYKAHAFLNLSDYELKKHNVDVALEYLTIGLQNDASSVLLNLLASDIYFRLNKKDLSLEYCKMAFNENNRILESNNVKTLAIGAKPEAILSKGIYYSLLVQNMDKLNYFLGEMKKVNGKLSFLMIKLIKNMVLSATEKKEAANLITPDNAEALLVLIENLSDKKTALEILKLAKSSFNNNSKYLKTIGLLYSENKLYGESISAFEESLSLKEKDPSSVLYLISVLIESNQLDKIPDLLLFADREFGNIPEFKTIFKNLKLKLNEIFSIQHPLGITEEP